MKKRSMFVTSLALTLSLTIAGCGGNTATPQTPTSGQEQKQTSNKVTYPLTITDATGKQITIKEEPKRIVSMLPSNTEILYALGLGDKVVGVTKWDDYPAEVKSKPVIGDMKADAEKIVAQKPDLVLGGASAQGKDIESLRGLGLTVVAFEPQTISDVEKTIQDVGKITNTTDKADEVVKAMEKKISDIQSKVKGIADDQKPTVYVEISPAPDIYTAGKGTFMDEMVNLAGGKNIAGDLTSWAKISAEQVVAKNPQIIISTTGTQADAKKDLTARSGWNVISAIKNDKIYAVDTNLASRPGPRIVDGLYEFAKAIHPDLFK